MCTAWGFPRYRSSLTAIRNCYETFLFRAVNSWNFAGLFAEILCISHAIRLSIGLYLSYTKALKRYGDSQKCKVYRILQFVLSDKELVLGIAIRKKNLLCKNGFPIRKNGFHIRPISENLHVPPELSYSDDHVIPFYQKHRDCSR